MRLADALAADKARVDNGLVVGNRLNVYGLRQIVHLGREDDGRPFRLRPRTVETFVHIPPPAKGVSEFQIDCESAAVVPENSGHDLIQAALKRRRKIDRVLTEPKVRTRSRRLAVLLGNRGETALGEFHLSAVSSAKNFRREILRVCHPAQPAHMSRKCRLTKRKRIRDQGRDDVVPEIVEAPDVVEPGVVAGPDWTDDTAIENRFQ